MSIRERHPRHPRHLRIIPDKTLGTTMRKGLIANGPSFLGGAHSLKPSPKDTQVTTDDAYWLRVVRATEVFKRPPANKQVPNKLVVRRTEVTCPVKVGDPDESGLALVLKPRGFTFTGDPFIKIPDASRESVAYDTGIICDGRKGSFAVFTIGDVFGVEVRDLQGGVPYLDEQIISQLTQFINPRSMQPMLNDDGTVVVHYDKHIMP